MYLLAFLEKDRAKLYHIFLPIWMRSIQLFADSHESGKTRRMNILYTSLNLSISLYLFAANSKYSGKRSKSSGTGHKCCCQPESVVAITLNSIGVRSDLINLYFICWIYYTVRLSGAIFSEHTALRKRNGAK
jgi:hypothetical protein